MYRRFVLPMACAAILSAGIGSAQDWRILLSPEAAASLTGPAAEAYRQAIFANDRVNYDEAVRYLAAAAELAPDNVDLQFLVANRARNRAEVYYSQSSFTQPPAGMDYTSPPWRTSEPFIDVADSALERLSVNPDLTTEQRQRLEAEMTRLGNERISLTERDRQRVETAKPLVTGIMERRKMDMNKGMDEFDELDPRNVLVTAKATEEKVDEYIDALEPASGESTDPFTTLPGEYIAPFLPPPPNPQQYDPRLQQQQQRDISRDPFAAPPPASSPFEDPAVPMGFEADGGGRFGGK